MLSLKYLDTGRMGFHNSPFGCSAISTRSTQKPQHLDGVVN